LLRSKRLFMSILLHKARKTEFQLWAENAPFELKDVLKGRGYRWDGAARCWYIVLDESALPAEEEFLCREVCPGRSVPFRRDKITARNRFSLMP
jgi:DNA polymerase III subunit epsilon